MIIDEWGTRVSDGGWMVSEGIDRVFLLVGAIVLVMQVARQGRIGVLSVSYIC